MKPENQYLRGLRTLILKSQSEVLSESEIIQLNELIQADGGPEEAAALIDQLSALTDSGSFDSLPMTELLSEVVGNRSAMESISTDSDSTVEDDEGCSVCPQPTNTDANGRASKLPWLVGIAASYLIVATLAWSIAKSSSNEQRWRSVARSLPPQAERNSVQLVSTTACVWQPSGNADPTLGKTLQHGEILSLLEGIAELRIGEGTKGEALVRIEGPASVHIRPNGRLGLLHGGITIKTLGNGSENTTIDTPIGLVRVDGHSSIGLVSNGAESEVHLFAGLAVIDPHRTTALANEIRLEDGEAIRISSLAGEDASVVKFEASKADFVSTRSAGYDSLDLGDAYVDAISDSKPSIYWRFEELKGDNPQFVKNQGTAPGLNAVVVGNPLWRQYGSNRVAELGVSASSAFQALEPWPENPLDEYTVEMWVKPQLFHHGEVICLHAPDALKDGRYPHTMMLETTAQHYFTHRLSDHPPNRFRFVHRALRSNEPIAVTSLFTKNAYQARVWQHVVTQKKGNRQLLWIDGQLSAEHTNRAPLTENVQILVGQVYPSSSYRRFVGQIDEVAIYDRCLPAQEIRMHIKASGRSIAKDKKSLLKK